MDKTRAWKYCVAGNIVKTHLDESGTLKYGTKAFSGGTKVFLCGKFWSGSQKAVTVIGRNRFKRYEVTDVPPELIENVRALKAYHPKVLQLMNDWEFSDCWWGNQKEDREGALAFVRQWNMQRETCAIDSTRK